MGTDAAFATLGLAVGARSFEITRAFRVLCRALHPDRGGDRRAFEAVVDAYRSLQRSGHVTPSPAQTAMTPPPRLSGSDRSARATNPYQSLRCDLERVANIELHPLPVAASTPGTRRTTQRSTGEHFARVLEEVLARRAA